MADFCWDCVQELGVEAVRNDMNDTPSQPRWPVDESDARTLPLRTLCEGCGPGLFDPEGHRLPDTPIQEGDR
jgi:hypothetical protein